MPSKVSSKGKAEKKPGLSKLLMIRPGKWPDWIEVRLMGQTVAVCQRKRLRVVERTALALKRYSRMEAVELVEALPYRQVWGKSKVNRLSQQ